MCGRFVQSSSADVYARMFGATHVLDAATIPPRYNVAPTQPVLVVREPSSGQRQVGLMRWGLIPGWSRGPDKRFFMINARAETVHEKPAYRGPLRYRRCLIPSDGFYEWKAEGRTKQPYFFRMSTPGPFAMAGLWDLWMGPHGEELESCAIIVTEANATVRPVHDRMPVILPPEAWAPWLDPLLQHPRDVRHLLEPCDPALLAAHPVSLRVNNPANDAADLMEPLDTAEE